MVALHQAESFRFSTNGLADRDRLEAVRRLRDRGLMPIEPLPDRRVHVDIAKWFLPGLGLLSGSMGGIRQDAAGPSGSDDLFFGVNVDGVAAITQRGREILPAGGDAFVVNVAAGAFAVTRPSRARFFGLRVPRRAIAPLVVDGADERLRLIPGASDTVTLLAGYLRALLGGGVLAVPEASRVIVAHVHDLIALSLGATSDAQAQAAHDSIPAARLRAIKSDIVANLTDEALSVGTVAARHRVTSRYVHRLFERDGVTYTEFVLRERLARAYRMLCDPRFAAETISAIAYDAGFGDLSYFNRAFRRQYQRTPSDVRGRR